MPDILNLSFENPEKDPEEEDKGRTRRKVIKAAAGVMGAAGIVKLVNIGEKDKKSHRSPETVNPEAEEKVPETKVLEVKRIFNPGETAQTFIGKMGVDGLKIYVEENGLETFWENSRDLNKRTGGLSLSDLELGGYNRVRYSAKVYDAKKNLRGGLEVSDDKPEDLTKREEDLPSKDNDDEDAVNDVRKPFEPKVIGTPIHFKTARGQEALGMYAFPVPEQPIITVDLSLHETSGQDSKTTIYRYHFAPKLYLAEEHKRETDSLPREEKGKVMIRAYSEVSLPPNALSMLHNLHKLCSDYQAPVKICVVEGNPHASKSERARYHGPSHGEGDDSHLIRMNVKAFLAPETPNEAEHIAFHDFATSIVRQTQKNDDKGFEQQKSQALSRLGEAHQALKAVLDPEDPNSKNHVCSKIFSRDSYVKRPQPGPGSRQGLKDWDFPWYEPAELFSSVVTTLRYFSREFIANYQKLPDAEKSVVQAIVKNELELLKSLNPDRAKLKQLIPQVDSVEAVLK